MPLLRSILSGVLILMAAARGQEPLRNLAEVKKLTFADAEQQRRPVVLRGICAGPSRFSPKASFFEGDDSLTAVFPSMNVLPPPNSEVEITGVTRTIKPRGFEEIAIEVETVRVLATGVTPRAIKVPVEALNSNEFRDRRVETEGIVVQMRIYEGDMHVFLAGAEGFTRFLFRGLPGLKLPDDWLHSRLQVRGVCLGINATPHFLAVNDLLNVAIVQRGEADPFSAREAKPAELLQERTGSGERVRFQAIVLHSGPDGIQYLRAEDGTPCVAEFFQPWKPASAAPELTSPVPPIPMLHTGDVVELTGSPRFRQGGLHMS